ncbi:hypothetical protein [Rhizobium leguminosarum]|uniref:hypothetical protein n=1 Tax=Rhizobium leguminosarum TaxID=384 RepID=UPI001C937927|nr:hypothetical protein [Rhizobium leguminosarum]MBY5812902.1 hypothetical protein [Rhizobium leguminosarum]
MTDHKVEVWGRMVEVSIHQSSKSVWVAVGEYMGQRVEVKGRSSGAALSLWKDAARYKGN